MTDYTPLLTMAEVRRRLYSGIEVPVDRFDISLAADRKAQRAEERTAVIDQLRAIREAYGDDSRSGVARGMWVEIFAKLGARIEAGAHDAE